MLDGAVTPIVTCGGTPPPGEQTGKQLADLYARALVGQNEVSPGRANAAQLGLRQRCDPPHCRRQPLRIARVRGDQIGAIVLGNSGQPVHDDGTTRRKIFHRLGGKGIAGEFTLGPTRVDHDMGQALQGNGFGTRNPVKLADVVSRLNAQEIACLCDHPGWNIYLPFMLFPLTHGISMIPNDTRDAAFDLGGDALAGADRSHPAGAVSGPVRAGAVRLSAVLGRFSAVALHHRG